MSHLPTIRPQLLPKLAFDYEGDFDDWYSLPGDLLNNSSDIIYSFTTDNDCAYHIVHLTRAMTLQQSNYYMANCRTNINDIDYFIYAIYPHCAIAAPYNGIVIHTGDDGWDTSDDDDEELVDDNDNESDDNLTVNINATKKNKITFPLSAPTASPDAASAASTDLDCVDGCLPMISLSESLEIIKYLLRGIPKPLREKFHKFVTNKLGKLLDVAE